MVGNRCLCKLISIIDIVYSNEKSMIVAPKSKRMEIITSIQVCLIPGMTINYNRNGVMKSFSCKSKASICVSKWEEHDCGAHNKKNGEYSEYPSLFHFMDEL